MSELRPLGECADFLSGGTPSKSVSRYWTGSIPWASAKDLKRLQLEDTEDHLTEEGVAAGTRLVSTGATLVLTRGMTLLHDVPIALVKRPMAFNQDLKGLIARPGVDPRFLVYALLAKREELLSYVELAGHGTGRLPTDRLKQLLLWMPPFTEQKVIAGILGALDDKIDLNRRMNQTLEAMAQALFRSWFVGFEPVVAKTEGRRPEGVDAETAALFPSRFVDSELGNVPEGWSVRPIGEVLTVCGGSTPSTSEPSFWEGGTIQWTTPKDLSGLDTHVVLESERRITEKGLASISSGLLPAGTVLLSSRAPIGYVALTVNPTAVNQGFIAMRCEGPLPNYYVLNWVLENVEHIKARANGTTFQEISKANFRPMLVVVPPAEILKVFVSVVAPLYDRVIANVRENRTLVELRDGLLPKLLSGEIRVGEAEAQVAESA